MPLYSSQLIILRLLFQLDADFFSFYNPVPPPLERCHLDMLCIFVRKIRWPKGILGLSGGAYLKLNLMAQYLAFEGQTSHFAAYDLHMCSD